MRLCRVKQELKIVFLGVRGNEMKDKMVKGGDYRMMEEKGVIG